MTYEKITRYIENRRLRLFREYMRDKFGARNYRITRENEVHAKTEKGWILFGYYPEVAFESVG